MPIAGSGQLADKLKKALIKWKRQLLGGALAWQRFGPTDQSGPLWLNASR